jgi:hypothetical protein
MNKNSWTSLWIGMVALMFSGLVAAQSANCVNACLAADCNATDYPTAAARNKCIVSSTPGCKASCLTATVPNLVGQLLGAVAGVLGPNLRLGTVTGPTTDPNLKVISQSPPAGNEVPIHTTVAIAIEAMPPNLASSLNVFNSGPDGGIWMYDNGVFTPANSMLVKSQQWVVMQIPNGHDAVFVDICYGEGNNAAVGCCESTLGGVCVAHDCGKVPGEPPLCYVGKQSKVWRGDSTAGIQQVSAYTW